MLKNLVILGAGAFSRETLWVAERMNLQYPQWNILGFVDKEDGESVDDYPVLGEEWLENCEDELFFTCGIGSGSVRKKIVERFLRRPNLRLATLVDPTAVIGKDCALGDGTIICAGTVLAIASKTGVNCILNLNCTLGHDSVLGDFCTVHPGSNISGNVTAEECAEIGTGAKVIQGKRIGAHSILGAGAVVVKDIPPHCTAVGCPAKPIKTLDKWGGGNKFTVYLRRPSGTLRDIRLRAA